MSARIRQAAVIAAGEGSRLKLGGFASHKPLVLIAGTPLVEHVLGNLRAAGVSKVSIIFNEEENDCAAFVKERFADLGLTVLLKTTASSLVSFGEVLARSEGGRTLVSTVDALCPTEDFVDFVRRAEARPPDATVMAVTPFVADEKPLWVTLGVDGRVTRFGGESGDAVTAGIYVVSEGVRRLARTPPAELARLRDFLGWLVERGEPVFAESIRKVVDVDRAEDVALAEQMVDEILVPPGGEGAVKT